MADVKFESFSIECKTAMNDSINAKLEECVGEIETQAKRNTRVDTSQTKNNWRHHVDNSKHVATVGNSSENAIWEEFGTGEHALNGDGRKGGWFYEDEKGNGHFTYGKKPSRAFWHAFTSLKSKIINYLQESLKGL